MGGAAVTRQSFGGDVQDRQKHSVTNFRCSVLFRIYLRSSFVGVLVS